MTGIPNPDQPDLWLVPPWPHDAGFSEIVAHFLRFTPCEDLSPATLLTYYEAYQSVLESASTADLTRPFQQSWAHDVRECVARCVTVHREKLSQPAR
jgi:hypothetical protein